MAKTDTRPIGIQRAELGLSSPTKRERRAIWARLSVPQAGIYRDQGGYKPFRLVERAHDHEARTKLITGGVRSSKSVSAAMESVAWLPHADLIWLAGDIYDLSRQEFDYIIEAALSLGWTHKRLITQPRNRSMPCVMTTLWGTRVETRSLHDVNTFVARAPDVIVLCEPGLADPRVLVKSRERLSTRRGLLWMAGTFEEARSNWMEKPWHDWARWPNSDNAKSFSVPTWHNHISYPGGRNDPEIMLMKNAMTEREFLLRCAGVPVPAPTLVMSDVWDRRKHTRSYGFQRIDEQGNLIPVYLAVDPGYSTGWYVVEVIQYIDNSGRCAVIDEIAVQSELHEAVIEMCKKRPWWPNVSTGTTDPNAERHIFGTATAAEMWWRYAKVKLDCPPSMHVNDTIARLKAVMKTPGGDTELYIHENCKRALWEMEHWRRKQTREGYGSPSKNNCDALKALGYFFSLRQMHGVTLRDTLIVRDYQIGN